MGRERYSLPKPHPSFLWAWHSPRGGCRLPEIDEGSGENTFSPALSSCLETGVTAPATEPAASTGLRRRHRRVRCQLLRHGVEVAQLLRVALGRVGDAGGALPLFQRAAMGLAAAGGLRARLALAGPARLARPPGCRHAAWPVAGDRPRHAALPAPEAAPPPGGACSAGPCRWTRIGAAVHASGAGSGAASRPPNPARGAARRATRAPPPPPPPLGHGAGGEQQAEARGHGEMTETGHAQASFDRAHRNARARPRIMRGSGAAAAVQPVPRQAEREARPRQRAAEAVGAGLGPGLLGEARRLPHQLGRLAAAAALEAAGRLRQRRGRRLGGIAPGQQVRRRDPGLQLPVGAAQRLQPQAEAAARRLGPRPARPAAAAPARARRIMPSRRPKARPAYAAAAARWRCAAGRAAGRWRGPAGAAGPRRRHSAHRPRIGQPRWAQCTRIWWVRPVFGRSSSQVSPAALPSTRQAVRAGWPAASTAIHQPSFAVLRLRSGASTCPPAAAGRRGPPPSRSSPPGRRRRARRARPASAWSGPAPGSRRCRCPAGAPAAAAASCPWPAPAASPRSEGPPRGPRCTGRPAGLSRISTWSSWCSSRASGSGGVRPSGGEA